MNDTEKLKLMIVDDRRENLLSMTQLLDRPDLEIVTAESGNEALGLMLDHDLALVLLDVQMPEMDGFEVAELMRRNDRTRNVPIIFVTAINKERRHIFSGYEAGAVDYLFKPVDPFVIRSKVGVFLDLKRNQQARERLVEELNSANNRLQEVSDLKSDYLSAASHELRTPLTVIKEYCGLVYDGVAGEINDEQKKCLASALRNCNRLASLVNDLLDLDSIESGHSRIRRGRVSIAGILAACRTDFEPNCGSAEQRLQLELPADLPLALGDGGMLTQIVVNLLGNAHKFTPAGGTIVLRASLNSKGDQVRVEVCDDGPGIAPEDQARVFDKFSQLGRRDGPGAKGTGLGLAISRKIVELHEGELGLDSETGRGSTFHFTVPAYSEEAHLKAFIADGTRNVLGLDQEWSLVILRTPGRDEELPSWLEQEIDLVFRRGEDTTQRLTLGGQEHCAILLQTERAGAMSFLARFENSIGRREERRGLLQYALRDVPRGQRNDYRLDGRNLDFLNLAMTEEEKGVEDVQETHSGR